MQAIDLIKRYLKKFEFGIYDGAMYKKAPDAKFTFIYCSSVNDFLHYILGNNELAEVVAPHLQTINHLLSAKACRIVQPISLDFNFIEVLPFGTCFDIRQKKFVKDPKDLKGLKTAFKTTLTKLFKGCEMH